MYSRHMLQLTVGTAKVHIIKYDVTIFNDSNHSMVPNSYHGQI